MVTIFRELRSGVTEDGRTKLKSPSGTLSTAEAISVVTNGLALATHFGDGSLSPEDLAGGLTGAVVQDPVQDKVIWQEYLEAVVRERDGWGALYRACRALDDPHRLRDPPPRTRVGPLAGTRARSAPARHGPDRGPAGGRRADRAGRAGGHGAAGRAAHLRPRRARPRRVLPLRPLLARVARDPPRARRTTSPCASWTCPPRTSWPTAASDEPRAGLRADPLEALAEVAGHGDPERWWEDVVESRREDDAFEAVTEAMAALREAFPDHDPAEERREAYMRQSIRAANKGAENVAVVCGAWHAPALLDLGPAAPDQRTLKGLPKVKVAATWVPWTYGLLARASGYGAGVDSPAWYDQLFDEAEDPVAALAQPRGAAAARRGPRRLGRAGGRRRPARDVTRGHPRPPAGGAGRADRCHTRRPVPWQRRAARARARRAGRRASARRGPRGHADGPAPAGRLPPAAAAADEARGAV